MDEFFENIKQYTVDESIEAQVKELLEEDGNVDSLNLFHIIHWVSNRSFGELIDMYESGEIIKPDM